MKILFIVPYPLSKSPSQRFRFEQYFQILAQNNFTFHVQSFVDDGGWAILYQPGKGLQKFWVITKGLWKRMLIPFHLYFYDFVFIHREAAPVGPPLLEWLIANVFRKKIIYDFDDAIWLTDRKNESYWFRLLKWRSKVASICKWSYKVSAGNLFLCNFARQYNLNVVLNPTTIDTEKVHNAALFKVNRNPHKVCIGWTGSHSTLKYLHSIEPVLATLEKKYPQLEFLVIADKAPELALQNLRFLPWSVETEISGLLQADIGIMPLPDDEWAKGKCGFKALQYMALEIPALASPVGVNIQIITHAQTGFLCSTNAEWEASLEVLITNSTLRTQMGTAGRAEVVNNYSLLSNCANFLSLFRK
ncbi:MAG: glycosyltransferase family 4 protein [Cyclobacteriaceae bacterium]|nr:glycosyltransferase family 4 protein [Cyclobacteriaceae bacterium]